MPTIHETEVIAPNFKQRLSGVTSTIIQLVPIQRRLGLKIAAVGPGLPESVLKLKFWQLLGLALPFGGRRQRVWHARRNIELVGGLILKFLLFAPLKLVFTSASQRQHRRFTKWLIRRADAVVATSRKTAAYLEVENQVIMHGIDTHRFCPAENQAELKRVRGFRGDSKLVGCFGRIRHQKGTDLFVDAMIRLLPQHPDWTAIIAGRTTVEHSAFEKDLRDRIAAASLSDRILFVGEHRDIEKWYQLLSLYVAPQRWEGFGLTPLEAMACGMPVVASDVGAFSELVVEGRTGVIVERDSLESLTTGIQKYLADPGLLQTHGKNALKHVSENFPLEREAQQLLQLYGRLLEDGRQQKRCA
jgi:mannosyltransferase